MYHNHLHFLSDYLPCKEEEEEGEEHHLSLLALPHVIESQGLDGYSASFAILALHS